MGEPLSVQARGDRVFAYVFVDGHAEASYDLVPLIDGGWDPAPLIPLLTQPDADRARTAAFVLSEVDPRSLVRWVHEIAGAARTPEAAVRSHLVDVLIRQPHSDERTSALRQASADPEPSIAAAAAGAYDRPSDARGSALTFDGATLLRLPERLWLDVRRFSTRWATDAREALTALARAPDYADTYLVEGPRFAPGVHGPYRLDALTRLAYETVTAGQARVVLEGAVQADQLAVVTDAWAEAGGDQADWFALRGLPDEAVHDAGWVLTSFIELVAVARDQSQLTVLVVGSD